MLDKQLAKKLASITNNQELWEPLKEYLLKLKDLELQVLVGATSEQEIYRSQGKASLLVRLEQLKANVSETLDRKE